MLDRTWIHNVCRLAPRLYFEYRLGPTSTSVAVGIGDGSRTILNKYTDILQVASAFPRVRAWILKRRYTLCMAIKS